MKTIKLLMSAALCALVLLALAGCGSSDSSTTAAKSGAESSAEPAVQVQELGDGTQTKNLAVDVKGPLQVKFRKITIPPGLGTGKHCHYGNLIAVVKQGTLTHFAPIYPGGVHTYKQGESIVEGSGYVHEGKNQGDENVVLMVTYITPKGEPPAETELKNCKSN